MLAPIMPHIAEELWQMLGKQTLAAKEQWPVANESMINSGEELTESIITKTAEDINQGAELTSKIDKDKKNNVKVKSI